MRTAPRTLATALAFAVVAAVSAACGSDDAEVSLHVLAAASLRESFTQIAGQFEGERRSADVTMEFAGSSTLVRQLHEGSPGDVLATADEQTMQQAVAAGDAESPHPFAKNSLAIAVPVGNPPGVRGLADLGRGLVVALAAPTVPVGRYAREAFARAGVPVPDASEELDAKAVVTKVELHEVDAGIVYATDVIAAKGRVTGVPIPPEHNVTATYFIAPARATRHRGLVAAFVAAVRAPAGQAVLRGHGFATP